MRRHAATRLLVSGAALAWALTLGLWTQAYSQTTTGSVTGVVRSEGGPVAGASVTARNVETNQTRQALTTATGVYYFGGLRPSTYELSVQMIGLAEQRQTLRLLVGQSVNLDFNLTAQAVEIAGIDVTATRAAETRTSEVATNITQEQIQNLPTPDRNFLALSILAPGTQLQGDRLDATRKTFTAGAQGAEQINVFIDGASYKNDILQGGVAGQDASRGNPFPRNAVREFRIITQNFKAEYQKASSAIITATTQSGTNRWQSHGFLNYQHEGLIALDTFQRATPNLVRPDFKRTQGGLSLGGPLKQDKLFFFGSFERNDQTRGRRVNITPPTGFGGNPTATYPALDTVNFAQYNGEFDEPFEAWLGFAKLTYEHRPGSTFELSFNLRNENDVRDFGNLTSFQSATQFNNDVNTGIAKHTLVKGNWLNEAAVTYQNYHYNPDPQASASVVNRFYGFGCCAQIGSNISNQDFTQKRLSFRDDVTRSGFQLGGEHVIKLGANVDFLDYDIIKRNAEIPRFVYESWFFDFRQPQRVEFQAGDPNFGTSNKQIGAYIQDDWSPTSRLVLNLGVRWDFESDMLNYDYVTPDRVVNALNTYRDSILIPFDINRYITDGNDREPWYGAFQPRVGFSYALDRDNKTSIFGGWGLFYDRVVFDFSIEEAFALQHPSYRILFLGPGEAPDGVRAPFDPAYLTDPEAVKVLTQNAAFNTPEMKLIPNDLKPPKAQHFNFGVRRSIGTFEVAAAYTGVRSENIFTFNWGNEDRPCAQRLASCRRRTTVPGFSTVLIGDDQGKTWYDALQLKVDRFYRSAGEDGWGWGAGLAVNFAKRESEGFNDLFTFLNSADFPKADRNDEPYRVVANWVLDVPYVWGIQFSGLLTLGAGAKLNVGTRDLGRVDLGATDPRSFEFGGFEPEKHSFIIPNAFAFRNLDLRLRKEFPTLRGQRVGVTADLFNVFNHDNLGSFNLGNRADPNFGKAGNVVSDARRLQIGIEYDMN